MDSQPDITSLGGDEKRSDAMAPDPHAGLVAVLDAFGAAWSTFQLYPNPAEQPAFTRRVEVVRDASAFPIAVEVGPTSFIVDGEEVATGSDGALRMLKRMFLHDVSGLKVVGPPTDEEVVEMFKILARELEDIRASGGAQALLAGEGVESLQLTQRALLVEDDEKKANKPRHPEVEAVLHERSDPERFAADLLAASEGEPDRLVEQFCGQYSGVFALVDMEDTAGLEELVRVFVEAYFYLPSEFQVPILEQMLAGRTEPSFEIFLDQLSGHELAALAPHLSSQGEIELRSYARVASDSVDERPEELLALLQSADEVKDARMAAAQRVGGLLAETQSEQSGHNPYADLAHASDADKTSIDVGIAVLRQLMAIEERDIRFRRILRIWGGKVSVCVRKGKLEDARRWLEACLEDPTHPPARQSEVDEALGGMVTPELIDALLAGLTDSDMTDAARLLEAWGSPVLDKLVEHLAVEDNPAQRRVLIDLLVGVSKVDHRPLLKHLSDKRWYVVRNLATVLGQTGDSSVAQRLALLIANHEDHRVRVEALRAMAGLGTATFLDSAIRALSDDHERVRSAALTVLSKSAVKNADEVLVAALRDKKLATQVRERVLNIIADRESSAGIAAIRDIASARGFFGRSKVLRNAAREALRKVAA